MLLLAIYFAFSFRGTGEGPLTNEPAPQINPGILVEYPAGAEFIIGTGKGGVTVKNFYKTAKGIVDQTEVVLDETKDYLIVYHAPNSNFDIYFLSKTNDFGTVRSVAESLFLSRLGVSKNDACKLDVVVNMPYNLDSIAGGKQPLSFCPPAL